jgi:hypothetical protein
MTIQIKYRRDCDRCAHPYLEKVVTAGDSLPVRDGPRYSMRCGEDLSDLLFDWADLCPGCAKVVAGLVDRIRLTPPPKKKDPTLLLEAEPPTDAPTLPEVSATEPVA